MKLLLAILLCSSAAAQTVNPSQIRPGANGQVLTTANGVTSWGAGGPASTTLSGAVTGTGAGTINTTIAPTGVTAGTYNLGSQVLTINAAGQITAAGNPFSATFNCTQCGTYETGYSVPSASGSISYANPSTPTSASVSDGTNTLALTSPFTSWAFNRAYTSNTVFTLTAVGNSQTVTQQQGIAFLPRTFGGVGTPGAPGATANGTNATLAGATGTLTSAGLNNQGSYGPYSASAQNVYVLMLGNAHTFSSGGFAFPMNTPTCFTFTNQYSASVPMCLYQSANQLGSAGNPATLTLIVTN